MERKNKENKINIDEEYYKAYDIRYKQVYESNCLWSSKDSSPDVLNIINSKKISKEDKILEIGCGEGRDAFSLLEKGFNVLAIDYSKTVINKCNELSNNLYRNHFKQFDIISDKMSEKFNFIYSIAVIHMFVNKNHRNIYYKFIYDHLVDNGIALIGTMGDGIKNYESDVRESFDNTKRTVINNNKEINIVATSCKIVDWTEFENELLNNNLKIIKKWISKDIPEFDNIMCVLVERL